MMSVHILILFENMFVTKYSWETFNRIELLWRIMINCERAHYLKKDVTEPRQYLDKVVYLYDVVMMCKTSGYALR